MTKSTYWALFGVLIIACIFSSCQSSKIAYGNAYYFKQTPKTIAPQEVADRVEAPERISSESISSEDLQASIAQKVQKAKDVETMIETSQKQLAENLEKSGNENLKKSVSHINELVASAKDQDLSKKEIRAKRKEIRKEIKSLAKEYRETAAPDKAGGLDDLDKNLRLAIIFWGAGLVLSIIGSIAGVAGSPVWILASLSWLVGSIFFIIWLVEEFS